MPMSSLNFCVIATEICLTLDNIGCTDITLEAAKAHLQDDELTKVDGEDLAIIRWGKHQVNAASMVGY